jgi:protocatechuate 3,4-dioxygenase beta subunit
VVTAAPTEVAATATPQSAAAAPAATCSSPATLTPALTEGPYFKAGSPERTSLLEPGMAGTKLVLTGYVLTADCKPVAHALIEFWQADAGGKYDNSGYTLRGHQYTDESGRYQLETVVPGEYPGRTEHIHVKVQAPNGPVLTTQLFFPGVARNSSDGIFNSSLVLPVQDTGNGLTATFNFVVRTR